MIYSNNLPCQTSIVGVLPIYDQHGNDACKIIYRNGTCKTVTQSVSHFIMKWLYSLNVDLIAQHMWSGELLGHEKNNPIIINRDTAFVPVKTRVPLNLNDGCHGYIAQGSIRDFNESRILLHNGVEIPYYGADTALSDKILDANALLYVYRTDSVTHLHKAAN